MVLFFIYDCHTMTFYYRSLRYIYVSLEKDKHRHPPNHPRRHTHTQKGQRKQTKQKAQETFVSSYQRLMLMMIMHDNDGEAQEMMIMRKMMGQVVPSIAW